MKEEMEGQPASMNAFELISLNRGLNLENLFETDKVRNISVAALCRMSLFQHIYVYHNLFHKN